MRPTYLAIGVIVLALVGGVAAGMIRSVGSVDTSASALNQWQLQKLTGEYGSLSDYRGQVVLINFWASWCGTCREEMPEIVKTWQDYKDRGFTALGVNYGEDRGEVDQFVRQYGINFPIYLDPGKKVAGQYGVISMPTSFLVSKQGAVVKLIPGQIDFKELTKEIERLLSESE